MVNYLTSKHEVANSVSYTFILEMFLSELYLERDASNLVAQRLHGNYKELFLCSNILQLNICSRDLSILSWLEVVEVRNRFSYEVLY